MTETEMINEGFMYLFSKKGTPANDRDNPNAKDGTELDVRRLLNRIYEIGFADRIENTQRTRDNNRIVYDYWLNSKAIHFIDTIPKEYENKPYSYYRKLDEDEKEIKKTRDDLDDKVKRITYGNIAFNKFMPLVALGVATLAIVVPVIMKNMSDGKVIKTESTLPQLQQVLENQQIELQILQDNLDSLQKLLKNVSK